MPMFLFLQAACWISHKCGFASRHTLSQPFSLRSPIIDFNVAYSSYKCERLNMEELLEMGMKPEQKDARSPHLLPAKPLEEIQAF